MARAAIAGSAPDHTGYQRLAAADPVTPVQATIVLRANYSTGGLENHPNSCAVEAVESFVRDHGLTVIGSNAAECRVVVRGTADQMKQVFGANLEWFESADGQRHLSYEGDVTLPAEIAPRVLAVLGLDQRPVAKPR